MKPKVYLQRGPTEARMKRVFEMGELVIDTTTMQAFVGDGQTPGGHFVSEIVAGPEGGLYAEVPEGFVPLALPSGETAAARRRRQMAEPSP